MVIRKYHQYLGCLPALLTALLALGHQFFAPYSYSQSTRGKILVSVQFNVDPALQGVKRSKRSLRVDRPLKTEMRIYPPSFLSASVSTSTSFASFSQVAHCVCLV